MRIFGEIIYRLSILLAILFLALWALFFLFIGHIPNPEIVLFRLAATALTMIGFGWLVKMIFG